jgi:hypothetical protein
VGEVSARLEVPGRAPLEKRATILVGKRSKLTFDIN